MKNKWITLMRIGFFPIALYLGAGVVSMFIGFTFVGSTIYGIEGFIGALTILGMIFWPVLLGGLSLAIFSILKADEKDLKEYYDKSKSK